MNIIPSWQNVFTALAIAGGLYLVVRLGKMTYYEITMYKGAGEDYLEKGLEYVRKRKRVYEELLSKKS